MWYYFWPVCITVSSDTYDRPLQSARCYGYSRSVQFASTTDNNQQNIRMLERRAWPGYKIHFYHSTPNPYKIIFKETIKQHQYRIIILEFLKLSSVVQYRVVLFRTSAVFGSFNLFFRRFMHFSPLLLFSFDCLYIFAQ